MITHDHVLKAATRTYELLENGWCQEAPAQNEKGSRIGPLSKQASAWSWYGAIDRAAYESFPNNRDSDERQILGLMLHIHCLRAVAQDNDYIMLINDNEETTQAKVLKWQKRAIRLLSVAKKDK